MPTHPEHPTTPPPHTCRLTPFRQDTDGGPVTATDQTDGWTLILARRPDDLDADGTDVADPEDQGWAYTWTDAAGRPRRTRAGYATPPAALVGALAASHYARATLEPPVTLVAVQ